VSPSLEGYELSRLRLVAPLRRSESGSRAFLGLASDGREYWMKAPNNPQGPRTLAAEVICSGIGRAIGAPVCESSLIDFPDTLNWEYGPALRLKGGIGHASLNIEESIVADEWETFSGLDNNRNRQALIVALWDLCMGVDPQWLHRVVADYSIWSFDHGFWLAGEVDWSVDSLRTVGLRPWQYDLDIAVASAGGLRAAADRVEALTLASIRVITDVVPLAWDTTSEELLAVAEILSLRTDGVAARLRIAADQSRHA